MTEFEERVLEQWRTFNCLLKCVVVLLLSIAICHIKENFMESDEKHSIAEEEEVCFIELNIYQQDNGELVLVPDHYGEIWPFEFDANENMIPKSQKNVLHISSPIDLDEKMRFRFALPMGPWYENSEFVAISPSGAEQIIKNVPGAPNLDINTFYEFFLEERGTYTIELRNLDDATECTSFSLVW